MASSGKKISLFDPSGMLTKEVLLGYIYNELPPAMRKEVEQHIAGNEMYQDMIEGLKLIPQRVQAEKIINSLNEEVAERSGSAASVPGLGENVGEFFWNYRRVAAVVGAALLLSAAVLTVALLKVSNPESGIALKKEAEKNATPEITSPSIQPEQPPAGNNFTPATTDSIQIQQPIAERDEDTEIQQKETTVGTITSSNSVTTGNSTYQWQASGGALEKKKEQSDTTSPITAGLKQTKTVSIDMPDANLAKDDKAAKGDASNKDVNDEIAAEETISVSAAKEKRNESAPAQTQEGYYKNETLATAEVMPEFPGGEAALKQYLHDNLKYPEKSKADGVQGKVNINFTVGNAGRIKDIVVIQGVNKEINSEAIRLVSSMPKWKPGSQGGKAVSVKQSLTIEFSLSGN